MLQQPARYETSHIDVNIRFVRRQEATHIVPETAATMRHDQGKLGKIDRHIIQVNRITVLDAGPRNHRTADVHEYRNACSLAGSVQRVDARVIRIIELVRWVQLQAANAAVDVS